MAAKGPSSQSDIPRWIRTTRERPRWDERNRMIAAYVQPGSSVLDIGAGAQTLSDHLPPGCEYQPADVVPGPGVLLCDLDADRWPEVEKRFDVAICSGVLEYLQDVPGALAGLASVAHRAIVTYSDRRRGQKIDTRVRQGWHSHLTLAELRAALDGLDGDWRFLTEWRTHVICAIDFAPGLPPLRDGDALIEEAAWESSFARLEAHARRIGSATMPNSLVEEGIGLGAWAQTQRRLRRRGTLSERRITRLEAVPGWSWRATRATTAAAPEIAREPGLGAGSLHPQRVEGDRLEWMAKAAQGDPILDMTCGQGTAAIALARAGLEVVGFDRDAEALEQVRARMSEETAETRGRLTLLEGGDVPLPLADDAFDTVMLADVADETGALLEEARRLVRPRGRVVLTSLLEVSPRALERPRASLGRLLAALGSELRPVQVVDGERWVGIVAVFGEAGEPAPEAWSALLEIAEGRLSRLGDAYADRTLLLDDARERQRDLARRLDEAVAEATRSGLEVEALRREVEALRREAEEAATRHRLEAEEAAARHGLEVEEEAARHGLEVKEAAARHGLEVEEAATRHGLEVEALRRQAEEAGTRHGLEVEALRVQLSEATARAGEAEREAQAARDVQARMAADTVVREQRLRDVRQDGRALIREVEERADQAHRLEADLAAAREAHAAATSRAAAAEARATALEGETAWIARERDAFASRLGAAESVAAWTTRRVAELDEAIAERDRRLAESKRLAVRRARAAARALEAARAEEAARLAALEEALHGKLAAEETRSARLQAQNEELRAGRVYRLAGRWWRLRRRLGGGPKKPRAK